MAVTQVYTAQSGDTITADRWNNEFGNLINNGTDVAFPLTKAVSFAGYTITWDASGNTTMVSSGSAGFAFAPGNKTGTPSNTGGVFNCAASTFTDSNTSGSGTATTWSGWAIQQPTLAATNSSVTTTDAASFYVVAVAAGTNETITNKWAIRCTAEDNRTNTVNTPLVVEATTSGTPAASIGTGIRFRAESQDEAPSEFGQIECVASDISTGSEDTYFQMLLRVAGAALTSCYRFVATGAFNAIFTHANTAARTYTLPDTTQSLAGITTILASGSLPSANSVDITNIPQTFASLCLVIAGASSDTATRALQCAVSYDNGSTFPTGQTFGYLNRNGTFSGSNGNFVLSPNAQAAAETCSFSLIFTGYQSGAYLQAQATGIYAASLPYSSTTVSINTGGMNALRIIWDGTGNFDAGTYALYGVS